MEPKAGKLRSRMKVYVSCLTLTRRPRRSGCPECSLLWTRKNYGNGCCCCCCCEKGLSTTKLVLLLLYDARAPRTCSFLPAFNFLLSRQELDFHLCFAACFFRCTVSLTISFHLLCGFFLSFFLGVGCGAV